MSCRNPWEPVVIVELFPLCTERSLSLVKLFVIIFVIVTFTLGVFVSSKYTFRLRRKRSSADREKVDELGDGHRFRDWVRCCFVSCFVDDVDLDRVGSRWQCVV